MEVINKPLCLVRAPVSTRSGYGEMSRMICRHLINLNKYDVKIWAVNWGMTPMDALHPENPKDMPIISRIMTQPNLPQQPDLFISVTIPIEFEPMGKYNIGFTAGIETTICAPEWIEGCNKMNTVWVISEFAKKVFEGTSYGKMDPQGRKVADVKINVPIEVLPCCADTNIIRKISSMSIPRSIDDLMLTVKENFNFLFVGHWLGGNLGQDRKDVGMLVKTFLETFKDVPASSRPGLILKTNGATFSIMDREQIIEKIDQIKHAIGNAETLPNVYLLHGDLTEEEMNGLYNHPKVKIHASFTKGEGFGIPLLEASISEKPVMASGWSGVTDFLDPTNAILLNGKLTPAEASAQWNGKGLEGAMWFTVDYTNASAVMKYVWKNYNQFLPRAAILGKKNREKFSFDAVQKITENLLDKYVPKFASQVKFELPMLKKLGDISAPPVATTS